MRAAPWILVAFALGLAAGYLVDDDGPEPAVERGTFPAMALDDPAVKALVAELAGLRAAVENRPIAPPRSAPAPIEGDDAEILGAWFEQLDQRLASLAGAVPGSAPESSMLAALDLPHEDFEPRPFPAREEYSTLEFSQRHMFWSCQQVLDAYGLPSEMSINPRGSLIWSYAEGDDELEFVFSEGHVLRVEW